MYANIQSRHYLILSKAHLLMTIKSLNYDPINLITNYAFTEENINIQT